MTRMGKRRPRKTLQELEKELLNGQKLQGPMTAREAVQKMEDDGIADRYAAEFKSIDKRGFFFRPRFPLMVSVDKICRGQMDASELVGVLRAQPRGYGELPAGF